MMLVRKLLNKRLFQCPDLIRRVGTKLERAFTCCAYSPTGGLGFLGLGGNGTVNGRGGVLDTAARGAYVDSKVGAHVLRALFEGITTFGIRSAQNTTNKSVQPRYAHCM